MLNKFVVIDLETTGNTPKKGDKIIQFAAVVIENGKITEQFSSLINPQKPIPVFIEELTGINNEMVKDAPLFTEITEKVQSLLEGAYFVAHNVLFDLSFLQEELLQAGSGGFYGSVLDTVEMARILYPTADSYKLSDLAEKENLSHDRPHQADSDALVTAELFLILLRRLSLLPAITVKQLTHLSGGLKSDLQLFLEEMGDTFEKSALLDSIEIINDIALKKDSIEKEIEILEKEKVKYPESDDEKVELIQNSIMSFVKRAGQFKMMDTVYQSLQLSRHTLIEAGTGVGKSLGYLLPLAYFAKQNNQPIIVSTHTIQLQEQLLNKDIPLLTNILPFEIEAVLLKGRNHYLNLEKFHQTLMDENDNYDTTLTKMQILVWLTETMTGDRDELNLSSGGQFYWNKIREEQTSLYEDKGWQDRDFYQKAKRNAQSADIIITNHSLLLNDIKSGGSILPASEYVVIDEAHHLEKVASRYFGYTLDYLSARLLFSQFGTYEQKQLFYDMEQLTSRLPASGTKLVTTFELNQLVLDVHYELDEFFKLMALYAKTKTANKKGINRIKVRYNSTDSGRERKALVHSAERLSFLLKDLINEIDSRLNWLKAEKNTLSIPQLHQVEDVSGFIAKLDEFRTILISCFIKDSMEVKWIEMDTRSPQNITTFLAQPATVAVHLKEKFFQTKKAVVLTSATLSVNHSFDYIMRELGLEANATGQVSIPSPFVYKNQVQLLIPDDLPEINSVSLEEYVISITEHIITIAEATKGRLLILFTAFDMLKKTYELIKESGFLNEYVLMAQGISSGSRSRLTRNFQRYEKAILLGTSSFWEGVDIPGEDLSCLVIVRLPFSPPDEPLTEAKCQLIVQQGRNAFSDYSLPEAILRFKQGFGRLIRTETDRGVIIVFDRRIITTQYGKAFLKSIPPVPVKKGKMTELASFIQKWL
ncbi:ATP-dependent DNA helicase DinG [Neobacillus drentensis]|uniref:ATP-dependent DNA helicase DinG n=1 Tax=Neobacillus drentensis TaxID=220684 RepID=UPI001F3BEACA|nr:ATP-dependent DNA helicase DinG [Neobacillus drentensis]ULT55454.1 ATP-dependent DNA helicase DinG [Neobacillus drentensis]